MTTIYENKKYILENKGRIIRHRDIKNLRDLECPICLEKFNNNREKEIIVTPCDHFFHLDCLLMTS